MKAEINEMNKGRFLALHIGCEMELPKETDTDQWCRAFLTGIMNGGAEAELQFGDLEDNASEEPEVISVSDTMAMLKPLSSISDEDAIEVAKIMGYSTRNIKEHFYKEYMAERGKVLPYLIQKGYQVSENPIELISVIDFLRSRGYALPWMGLTVDEMVQAGWIKLT